MRGTLPLSFFLFPFLRIIPAHAGNTDRTVLGVKFLSDHPRACGEHPDRERENLRSSGSSPRMRGTRMDHIVMVYKDRIIPAHAGNTEKHP